MSLKNMMTLTEAAKKIGVSRQRMHVLVRTYDLTTEKAGPIRMLDAAELRKIPKNRPTGKKVSNKTR